MTMGRSMAGVLNITDVYDPTNTSSVVFGPARTAEFNFLATGNWPKMTNDTLVSIYEPGCNRGPIEDPYTAPNGPLAGDGNVFA